MIEEFLKLLNSEVNRGIYVWGADGEVLDGMTDPVAWIERKEQTTVDAARAIKLYKKRKAAGIKNIRAFDCSGLIYWALHTIGLQKNDVNSRGLYRLCDKIGEKDLQPGDLVFHHDGKQIVHVGVCADEGYQIECRGRDVGVVKNKRSKGYWNRFGRFPGLIQQPKEKAVYVKGGSVRLREGDNTKTRCIGIAHRGDSFTLIGESRVTGWYKVIWRGTEAYITNKPQYTEVVDDG